MAAQPRNLPPFSSIFPPIRIDLNSRKIRTVTLMPGRWTDPIVCTVAKACLDDNPEYDALSYVWGDPSVCKPIYVNDRVRNVTVKLFAALYRLRGVSEPRTLGCS